MDKDEIIDRVDTLFSLMTLLPDAVEASEVDELIRFATATNDPEAIFETAAVGVFAYSRTGQSERAVAAFAMCLAHFDDVDTPCERLLIPYKIALARVQDLPQISWDNLRGMEADFLKRLHTYGFNPEPVLFVGWKLRASMGHVQEAMEMFERWLEQPRSDLSDCLACCENAVLRLYAHCGENESAVDKANEILERELTCGAIPMETHAEVLLPLMRLDRMQEARQHQSDGMKLLESQMCIYTLGKHFPFLLRIGERESVQRLLEENLAEAVETTSVENRLFIFQGAWFLFELLSREGQSNVAVSLPSDMGCFKDNGIYDCSELASWFRDECTQMQGQYDARNGNDYYTRCATEAAQLAGL